MVTLGTPQLAPLERDLGPSILKAPAARPPHALAHLLVHKLLPARPPRLAQHDRLLLPHPLPGAGGMHSLAVPVRRNHGIGRALPYDSLTRLPARQLLGFIAPRRQPGAPPAGLVPTAVAGAGLVDLAAALVALPVDAHAHRLLHADHVAFGLVPGLRVHLEAVALREVPGALGVELGPGDPFPFEGCGWGVVGL